MKNCKIKATTMKNRLIICPVCQCSLILCKGSLIYIVYLCSVPLSPLDVVVWDIMKTNYCQATSDVKGCYSFPIQLSFIYIVFEQSYLGSDPCLSQLMSGSSLPLVHIHNNHLFNLLWTLSNVHILIFFKSFILEQKCIRGPW